MILALLLGCAHHVAPDTSGTFADQSCGDRAFPREITLGEGTYSGRDLVSPCPAGATCIWSGIVEFNGTWTRDGDAILLHESESKPQAGPSARPTRLVPDRAGWKDENGCSYAKIVTRVG